MDKKHYSESLAHICRREFSTILETEGLLSKVLEENFAHSKTLGNDLENLDRLKFFKKIIFKASGIENKELFDNGGSPKELLEQAGYILYPECKTEKDIQAFRHYYHRESGQTPVYYEGETPEKRNGEELCTFNGGRLDFFRVWFAVKKNVDEIHREDFESPQRQDDYGTSVISIQISKDKCLYISIKNRYNHTVKNPDATFSNNLDNIIPGLTNAFAREFEIDFGDKIIEEIEDYVGGGDGKRYRENIEKDGIHYCENNTILYQNEIIKLPPHMTLVDNIIFDSKDKKIYLFEKNEYRDCPYFKGEVTNIDIQNEKGGGKTITASFKDGDDVKLTCGSHNELLSIYDPNLEYMDNKSFELHHYLKSIDYPNLREMVGCFKGVDSLESINLPSITKIGYSFLIAKSLTNLYLPNVEEIVSSFQHVGSLISLSLPNVENIGFSFDEANLLTNLDMPNIKIINDSFKIANSLRTLSLSNVQKLKDDCFKNAPALESVELPSLIGCDPNIFENSNSLLEVNCPLENDTILKLKSIAEENRSLLDRTTDSLIESQIVDEENSIEHYDCLTYGEN